MLPDDVCCRVALDALRTDVPGGDLAVDVEHEDRIFGHAFDEQAKPLFALAQGFFVTAPLREVASDFREPQQASVGIAHGRDDDVRPEERSVLPDTPALVLEGTDFLRYPQLVLGQSARKRLGRVEP
ncbi:MAG: hypothetical protein ABI460_06545 [Caldimonas sp.]